MLHETWKEQYGRMERSFALLKQTGDPTPLPQDVIPGRDVLYHFCCDAFHLRDWIAATNRSDARSRNRAIAQLDKEVIKPSPELSACRDIANGFKHLVLDGKSYVTGTNQGHSEVVSHSINLGVAPARVTVDRTTQTFTELPSSGGYIQDTFLIDIGGQQHDARDVATKAVAAWDQWLAGDSPLAVQLRQDIADTARE